MTQLSDVEQGLKPVDRIEKVCFVYILDIGVGTNKVLHRQLVNSSARNFRYSKNIYINLLKKAKA
jgi:hypothetical protein